jgi:hypothetical protein
MTKVHYGSLLQVLIVDPGRRCGYAGGLLELIVGVRANDGRSSEESWSLRMDCETSGRMQLDKAPSWYSVQGDVSVIDSNTSVTESAIRARQRDSSAPKSAFSLTIANSRKR